MIILAVSDLQAFTQGNCGHAWVPMVQMILLMMTTDNSGHVWVPMVLMVLLMMTKIPMLMLMHCHLALGH